MEEKETIHINLLTELTGNLISEESEWEEEWTENDAYGMPLDGTELYMAALVGKMTQNIPPKWRFAEDVCHI